MYSEKVTSSSESDQEDFRELAEFEAQVWNSWMKLVMREMHVSQP